MKVVLLCDFATANGGAPEVAIESARALARAGADVLFVHAIEGEDARLSGPRLATLSLGESDIWARPRHEALRQGIWNGGAARRLAAILDALPRGEPTVLHIHQWTRGFSPALFQAARRSALPVVVTAHDYFLRCPTGVLFRFDRLEPCALSPLGPSCLLAPCDPQSRLHKAVRVARSLATAWAIAGAELDVVHVSDRGLATLKPLLPPRTRHHRIDNPIPIEKRAPASIDADAPFAFIGRLTREKGAVLAAEAAALAQVPIRFIGAGPAEGEIRAICPQAEIAGWQPREAVRAALAGRIRAVLAPSLWPETGPLTVAEAAAAGVAAIASTRCGAGEKLADGTTGLRVEPTPADLAQALRALTEIATARRMGAAAHAAFWADPPTPDRHAARLLGLYQSVTGSAAAHA